GLRDLGGPARAGRVEGALVGRRQEGAGLPVGGDGDPLAEQGVVAKLGPGGDRREVAGVDGVARHGAVVEVEDLPAVGEATTGLDHVPDAIPSEDQRATRRSPGTARAPDRWG